MADSTNDISRRNFVGVVAAGGLGLAGLGAALPFATPAFADEGKAASTEAEPVRYVQPFATPAVNEEAERMADPRRILVVVDYQVDFVDGGVFGRIEPALAIEDALYNRIKEYQDAGDIVIYTMDTHPQDNYADTREGQVNPPHCIPGTEGWEVYGRVGELLTPEAALLLKKGTYGSRDLPALIQGIQAQGVFVESIEFAGVSTTCRVLHNAVLVYNFFPEIPLVFDDSTTASYTDERTTEQLDELEAWGFIVKRSPDYTGSGSDRKGQVG